MKANESSFSVPFGDEADSSDSFTYRPQSLLIKCILYNSLQGEHKPDLYVDVLSSTLQYEQTFELSSSSGTKTSVSIINVP